MGAADRSFCSLTDPAVRLLLSNFFYVAIQGLVASS